MNKLSLVSFLILFIAQPSMALFEVRAGGGFLNSAPNLAKFYTGTSADVPSASPNAGLTLDAIATIPLVGLGGGLRMENMKISYDSSVLDITNELSRTSLIVNYRLINTLVYVGPIATYGLSHTNKISIGNAAGDLSKITSSKVSSYSAGLEAGVSIIGFMVGAEVGKMWMNYKDATDSISGTIGDLDMSGNYAKLFIGFGI